MCCLIFRSSLRSQRVIFKLVRNSIFSGTSLASVLKVLQDEKSWRWFLLKLSKQSDTHTNVQKSITSQQKVITKITQLLVKDLRAYHSHFLESSKVTFQNCHWWNNQRYFWCPQWLLAKEVIRRPKLLRHY